MKQRRRKTRITVRTQEVLIIRGAGQMAGEPCPVCGTPFPAQNTLAASHAPEEDAARAGGLQDDGERKLLPAASCANHTEDGEPERRHPALD